MSETVTIPAEEYAALVRLRAHALDCVAALAEVGVTYDRFRNEVACWRAFAAVAMDECHVWPESDETLAMLHKGIVEATSERLRAAAGPARARVEATTSGEEMAAVGAMVVVLTEGASGGDR